MPAANVIASSLLLLSFKKFSRFFFLTQTMSAITPGRVAWKLQNSLTFWNNLGFYERCWQCWEGI